MSAARLILPIISMMTVVAASNYLVQFPVNFSAGPLNLADLLTYGAFTYPAAFLVTDLTNRRFGPARARLVVLIGFVLAVLLSVWLASPRIAIASGSAFLTAQLLDVAIFDRLRQGRWWRAPLVSSIAGSVLDTVLFFSMAFAAGFDVLGPHDDFAIASAPLLGLMAFEAPRWMSWALGDLAVKLLVALMMLAPYRMLRAWLAPQDFRLESNGA
ncbi:MAG: hypothetical protein C0605_10535 [Hyphomicrobiales bacterium]|nr:MAG: hypothetical protein C0605_10535 [Hyphomicrobiales bacterium]